MTPIFSLDAKINGSPGGFAPPVEGAIVRWGEVSGRADGCSFKGQTPAGLNPSGRP